VPTGNRTVRMVTLVVGRSTRTTVPLMILSHEATSIRASVREPSGKDESLSIEVSVCINRPRDKSWLDSKGEPFSSLPPVPRCSLVHLSRPLETSRYSVLLADVI